MTALAGADIVVEVVYAETSRAIQKAYRLSAPVTVAQIRHTAAADDDFRAVDMNNAVLGVFGQVAAEEQILMDGDRVEIYRPLAVDPKVARRARVTEVRKKLRREKSAGSNRSSKSDPS